MRAKVLIRTFVQTFTVIRPFAIAYRIITQNKRHVCHFKAWILEDARFFLLSGRTDFSISDGSKVLNILKWYFFNIICYLFLVII